MKPQTAAVAAGVVLIMLLTLWASFGTSSSHAEDISTTDPPDTATSHPINIIPNPLRTKVEPSRADDGDVGTDVQQQEPVAQPLHLPPRAPQNMERDTGNIEDSKSSSEDIEAANDTIARPPLHITGRWTEALHLEQLALMKQVPGAWDGSCVARTQRPNDPPPKSRDVLIRQRLYTREACNALLTKVPWTRQELIQDLTEFVNGVYPRRPIKFNRLGMRLTHAFGAWFLAKRLQPEYIIENGVHLGQSTWLFRQACPNVKIISLDPRADMQYWDSGATYYVADGPHRAGYDIKPFRDFGDMDWSFIKDKDKALVLFDDHQNMLKRVRQAHRHGFRHIMTDDNWSPLQGDNYSVKQMCDESGGLALRDPNFPSTRVLMTDNFHMADKFISLQEHRKNREAVLAVTKVYWEVPPVLFVPCQMEYTKFGHTPKRDNPENIDYVVPKPSGLLLKWMAEALIAPPIVQTQDEFEAVGLGRLDKQEFLNYANFGYLVLAEG